MNKSQFKSTEKNNTKRILYILKNLPEEIYEDFINNQEPIEKRLNDYSSPNKISISNPNSFNDSVQIFNNFEIIEKSIAKEFFSGIKASPKETKRTDDENYFECTLIDGKIIIYYPKSKFNNGKFIYAVGKLNEDIIFINEYLFIYRKEKEHFDSIKNILNNYLQGIQFLNNSYPLVNSGYIELGIIIKLDKEENKLNIKAQITLKIKVNNINIINFHQAYIIPKKLVNK